MRTSQQAPSSTAAHACAVVDVPCNLRGQGNHATMQVGLPVKPLLLLLLFFFFQGLHAGAVGSGGRGVGLGRVLTHRGVLLAFRHWSAGTEALQESAFPMPLWLSRAAL